MIIGFLICLLAIPNIHTSIYWFIPILGLMGFFNSIQFTSMNTISIADLRNSHTSSGNSLLAVNQQLSIGFGIAFGLIVLKLFESQLSTTGADPHLAFRYSFFVMGILTIISGFVFRRLHSKDGQNMRAKQ